MVTKDDVKDDAVVAKSTKDDSGPGWYYVKLSHPSERRRTVFRSVSEKRARAHIENRYPRGSEAYLEKPDGSTESFENERQGEHGTDADPWASFDVESYKPPEEAPAPGTSQWGDVEG
jgi:hypothetical protein